MTSHFQTWLRVFATHTGTYTHGNLGGPHRRSIVLRSHQALLPTMTPYSAATIRTLGVFYGAHSSTNENHYARTKYPDDARELIEQQEREKARGLSTTAKDHPSKPPGIARHRESLWFVNKRDAARPMHAARTRGKSPWCRGTNPMNDGSGRGEMKEEGGQG